MARRESGLSLLELMISLGLMSVLVLGVATFLSNQQVTVNQLRHVLLMHQMAKTMEEAAGRPDVISFSAFHSILPGNVALRQCITANTPGSAPAVGVTCTATDPLHPQPFALILPYGELVGAGQASDTSDEAMLQKHTVAGTFDVPVSYSLEGKKDCLQADPPDPSCQLRAYAYFWASCPPNFSSVSSSGAAGLAPPSLPTSCAVADTIHILYQLVHDPTTIPMGRHAGQLLPSIPPDSVFYIDIPAQTKSTLTAISTPVSLLPLERQQSFQCPVNYSLVQVENGQPVCKCLYPFEEFKSNFGSTCIASTQTCGINQRYQGTDEKGNIICLPITCNTISDLNATCGVGGWIQKISYTGCSAQTCQFQKNGGGCSSQISCTGSITCCYDAQHS